MIPNHFGDSVSGPEKAGVGGSIPSLATNPSNDLATKKKRVRIPRAHNTRTSVASNFTFGVARSNDIHIFRPVLLVPRIVAERFVTLILSGLRSLPPPKDRSKLKAL